MYIHDCIYTHKHAFEHCACTYNSVHSHTHTYTLTHSHTLTHTHSHTHTHTLTHTHTQDCCSELEAMGAGAAHASSKIEKQEQINRDVPRICYKILDKVYGCAMGEFMERNVQEKMVSL